MLLRYLGMMLVGSIAAGCSCDGSGRPDSGMPSGQRGEEPAKNTGGAGGSRAMTSGDGGTPRPAWADAGTGCGAACTTEVFGQDGTGFDLISSPNEGVRLDDDGAIVADLGDPAKTEGFIWVSNTRAIPPTVSKIDTRTMKVVGRYEVLANDPSRTSLSLSGDAYVASRTGMAITKISGLGANCPDTNGDGMVTTSTGPDDVLPFGEDDCLLWSRKFDQDIRAVAAQDIPSVTTVEPRPDEPPLVTTTPEEHYVWVGASTVGGGPEPMAYKLDGDTGEILITTKLPRGAYGFALDGRGILWLTGGSFWDGGLAFIDTNQCVDDASCDVAPCTSTCSATSCPTSCDGAVKGDITLSPSYAYGITVDCKQRVWLGNPIRRYDPLAPADERLKDAVPGANATGVAVDANGWVWGAAHTSITRLDADTLTQMANIALPQGSTTHGVAVDLQGKIWGINVGPTLHVVTPGAELMDNPVTANVVTGLADPYSYSDMTGVQQRLAVGRDPGSYRQLFEGCDEGTTEWKTFVWDVETPASTRVLFRARIANSLAELEDADWVPIAGAPAVVNEAQLVQVLNLSGEHGKYFEIEALLYVDVGSTDKCGGTDAASPRIRNLAVSHDCTDVPRAPD